MKETGGAPQLPGLDCGMCGNRSCEEFAARIVEQPEEMVRCIHIGEGAAVQNVCSPGTALKVPAAPAPKGSWTDTLGREFDFILDTLPGDPGPRETILPHNPLLTREMEIAVGDLLIGRPLGMSCGCPITHCGIVMEVDRKTGVIVWCVTGPLGPRRQGFKDIGYYVAEAYDGLVRETRTDLRIGMRYFFLPHRCMLQWRHSGLINFMNKVEGATAIRLEGLWIG